MANDNSWIPSKRDTHLKEDSERLYYLHDELGSTTKIIKEYESLLRRPSIMSTSSNISPVCVAAISSVIGLIIAANLNADENNLIGNVLFVIGSIMIVVAVQQTNISTKQSLEEQYDFFKRQIDMLQSQIRKH